MDSPQRIAPTTVRASFWLWIASVILSVIVVIVALASGQYANLDLGENAELARALAPWAAFAGIAIGGGLRVVCAIFLLRGHRWARIVLLIIAIISLLSGFSTVISGDIVALVVMLITIAAGVLMFAPASNAYFRRA